MKTEFASLKRLWEGRMVNLVIKDHFFGSVKITRFNEIFLEVIGEGGVRELIPYTAIAKIQMVR